MKLRCIRVRRGTHFQREGYCEAEATATRGLLMYGRTAVRGHVTVVPIDAAARTLDGVHAPLIRALHHRAIEARENP